MKRRIGSWVIAAAIVFLLPGFAMAQKVEIPPPKIGLVLQPEFRYYEGEVAPSADSQFAIRRVRLAFGGSILDLVGYTLVWNGNNQVLHDAFVELTLHSMFNIGMGLWRVPFGIETPHWPVGTSSTTPFILRSEMVQLLGGQNNALMTSRRFRDTGLFLRGNVKSIGLTWKAALTNGESGPTNDSSVAGSAPPADTNDHQNYYLFFNAGPPMLIGLEFGGSVMYGREDEIAATAGDDLTENAYAGHAYYNNKDLGAWFWFEAMLGRFRTTTAGPAPYQRPRGYLAAAGFKLPMLSKVEFKGRYEDFDADKDRSGQNARVYTFGIQYSIAGNNEFNLNYIYRDVDAGFTLPNAEGFGASAGSGHQRLLITQYQVAF